jgi:hypothetical protein
MDAEKIKAAFWSLLKFNRKLRYWLFFNLSHHKVSNYEISNLFEHNQNFAVNFQKYQKQNQVNKVHKNWMKAKYYTKKIPETLLVSWNLINFCNVSQFLVKFCKSPKDLRKILLKWLEKKNNKILTQFVNFQSCHEKWPKVGQTSSITLTNVYGIQWSFSQS